MVRHWLFKVQQTVSSIILFAYESVFTVLLEVLFFVKAWSEKENRNFLISKNYF
jgi:hypothetical protein